MPEPRPVGFTAPTAKPRTAATSITHVDKPDQPVTISFESGGPELAFFNGRDSAYALDSEALNVGRIAPRDRAVARGLLLYALDRLDKEDAR
jgi:hypothetical protein